MAIAATVFYPPTGVLSGDTAGGGLGGTYPDPTVDMAAAKIVVVEATGDMSAEVNLGALTSGLLKHTVAAGVSTPATALVGTDYSAGTAALGTGIVKSTTTSGALSIASAGSDYQAPLTARTNYAVNDAWLHKYLGRAVSLAGLTSGKVDAFYEDFVRTTGATAAPPGWTHAANGTGVLNMIVAGSRGGTMQLSSGTSVSYSAAFTNGPVVSNITTVKCGFAFQFQITTAVDAETRVGLGLFNLAGNKTVLAGFHGDLNGGLVYNVQYDGVVTGTGLSLVTAVGTGIHTVEVWFDGAGNISASLDGGATQTAAMASAPTDAMYPYFTCRNYVGGGTAAARTVNIEHALYYTEGSV